MNWMSRVLALCLLAAFLISTTPVLAAEPTCSAQAAILIDADSGRILYAKNENEKRPIASTTKLLTALVALESQPDLGQTVKIKPEWTGAEGSSIYLRPNEELQMETLLYGLLLHSGNDAAVALAGYCAGDPETFVDWMNRRAKDLGMTRSHFQNPNGLHDDTHYSTAADMAKLAVACLKNENLAKIVSTKSISLEGRTFTNHNKLLWRYPNCVGLKTGYTEDAGRTLVSSAQKDGQTLVVVTLSDPDDWRDHQALFDYGFSTFPKTVPIQAGDEPAVLPVEGSLRRSVPVYAKESLSYPLAEEEELALVMDLPETAKAPFEKGEIAGRIQLLRQGKVVDETYLLYGLSATRDAVTANRGIRRMLDLFRSGKTGLSIPLLVQGDV